MPKSITIYSTVNCPYCRLEKQWLEKNGIKYKNIFVDENGEAADEMIKKSKQMGVPVTIIASDKGKEQIIIGFDKPKLAEVLGIKE
jgi:alkyl hydroperoxide reductase subunit F